MSATSAIVFLFFAPSVAVARPHPIRAITHPVRTIKLWQHKPWFQPIEHMAIGAGVSVAVSAASGNIRNWEPGMVGAALTAGWKEGSDAWAGRDSKKSAAFDAIEIVAGAAVAASASR